MKSLTQFLTENNIDYYVYFPSDLRDGEPIISKKIYEPDEEDGEEFNPDNLLELNGKGNIAVIWWNDESCDGLILNYKNEKEYQKHIEKVAEEWWPDYQNDQYMEFDDWFFGELTGAMIPTEIYSKLLKFVNDSYVNGDSDDCYLIVDLKAKKVIAGGENSEPTFNY